jgi:hypothetical protein
MLPITRPTPIKDCLSTLLDGDFQTAELNFSTLNHQRWFNNKNHEISWWQEGKLTLEASDSLCFKFPVKKEQFQLLLRIFNESELFDADLTNLKILRILRLLDEQNKITEIGLAKLIEMSPLKQQAQLLGVELLETNFEEVENQTAEQYVLRKYEGMGYQCWHDEGNNFAFLINYSMLNEVQLLKSYLNNNVIAQNNKHFELSLNLAYFMDVMTADSFDFSDENKEKLLNILRKTTKDRVLIGYEIWRRANAELYGIQNETSSHIDSVLKFFSVIGLEKFLSFAEFRINHYKAAWGWPDIVAIKGTEIRLIEVKRKDKLSYSQARSHLKLKNMLKCGMISGLLIEKISVAPNSHKAQPS